MKYQILNIKYCLFLICIFTFYCLIFNIEKASAQSSSNNNYNLEIEDVDTEQKILITPPQALETEATIEKPTTEVARETAPMLFSISTRLVDFGPLSPNNPTLRTATLSILTENSDYNIQAFEDHPLRSPNNTILADTTCDNGGCSEANSALWVSNLTYGFGFRCDNLVGVNCKDSANLDFYRQFANISSLEIAQAVMTGRGEKIEKKGQITLKLNTSGTQPPASYGNSLTFIAVPNF